MNARRLILSGFAAVFGVLVCVGAPALAGAAQAPVVEEAFVTGVASTSATLHATVNPQGGETSYAFEYAKAGGSFAAVAEPEGHGSIVEGTSGVSLEVHVQQGLEPNTAYQFRIVVGNSAQVGVAGEVVSFTTQSAGGEFVLPDGRQYEMVTPPQKHGALFSSVDGVVGENEGSEGVIQPSVDGDAIALEATAPSESEPQGYSVPSVSVLATRGPSGWSSQVIEAPHAEGTGIAGNQINVYKGFSADLSRGVLQPRGAFDPLLSGEASESTAFLRTDFLNGNVDERCQSSCYTPLVTHPGDDTADPFQPFGGANAQGECTVGACGPFDVAGTPDFSHVLLSSNVPLTSVKAEGNNVYEWSAGQLQLVSILPGGSEGAGLLVAGTTEDRHVGARNAISADGSRVILEGGGLYLRDLAREETVQLDLPEPGCKSCVVSGGGEYMAASSDDSRIFFLDANPLTSEHSEGDQDLYEYDVDAPLGKRLTDLSVDQNKGEGANVRVVLNVSEDGSYVYFIAGGRLTLGAPATNCPTEPGAGSCDLYVRHDGTTAFIAELSDEDRDFWEYSIDGLQGMRARVSPDGRWLAFMSDRDLVGYDTADANSGRPDEEVYLYHAPEDLASQAGALVCASCDPTGARPVGHEHYGGFGVASLVPGWVETRQYGNNIEPYQPRYLSDSGRLFLETLDALVPQDTNGALDVYEYEPEGVPAGERSCSAGSVSGSEVFESARSAEVAGRLVQSGAGCVALVSAGTSPDPSSFLGASEGGGEGELGEPGGEGGGNVFLLTTSKLAPQDFDDAPDVYDAHECTGASPCIVPPAVLPPACDTEASCRLAPLPQPAIFGAPASATFSGQGNVRPVGGGEPAPVRVVKTVQCRRGFVRRHGKCARVGARRRAKRAKRARRAGNQRRARS